MTHDEFEASGLDESSGRLAIYLKDGLPPIQPVRLSEPLPTEDQSILCYTQFEVKTHTIRFFIDIKLIIGEEMSGVSYVYLAEVESIVVLPRIIRNNKALAE